MIVSEETIESVIYNFRNLKEEIKNHRNYILTALYNAASSENVGVEMMFRKNNPKEEVRK